MESQTEAAANPAPVVMFSTPKVLPDTYSQIIKNLKKTIPDAEMRENGSLDDFHNLIMNEHRALLVYYVSDRDELAAILNFIPHLNEAMRERRAAIVIYSKVSSDKVDEILRRAGCVDVLRYSDSAKAFLFKLRRYLIGIRPVVSQTEELEIIEIKKSSIDKTLDKADAKNQSSRKTSKSLEIATSHHLRSPFDYWLIRKFPYINRYKGQWMVELIGPSLTVGKWRLTNEYDPIFPNEDMIWEWHIREAPAGQFKQFNPSPAKWVFIGKKPEYSWVVNRWAFIGMSPGLYLLQDGKIIETRFNENNEGALDIAVNSPQAIKWTGAIHETFNPDYFLQLEKADAGGFEIKLDPPANIPWFDKVDSKSIDPKSSNTHDLNQEDGPEWNTDLSESEQKSAPKDNADLQTQIDLDIPLGANAMRDCGITAMMNGEEVELISYSENQPIIIIGTSAKLKITDQVEIRIQSENLTEDLNFNIQGTVGQIETDPLGRMVANVALRPDSHRKIAKIRAVVERRQAEVFEFFKRAKGIG
jgi:hypothetical protein